MGNYLAAIPKLERVERTVFGENSYFLNKEMGTLTFMDEEDENSVPDRAVEDESDECEAMCDVEIEETVEGERMCDVEGGGMYRSA